jgi:serpin B
MSRLDRRKFLAVSAGVAAASLEQVTNSFTSLASAAEPAVDPGKLVMGNTAFGFDLYGELRNDSGNLFLSPFSISTALGMAAAGAKGKTLEEMERVMHLPADAHNAFGTVIRSLNAEVDDKKRGFTLNTANALWAQKGYPWNPEYKKLVSNAYAAGLFDVDFISAPEAARGTINTWVEKETHEKIKELLPRDSVSSDTRLVLTNAIYFKGDWQNKFEKKDTKDLPFTMADGKKIDTPLMFRIGGYSYAEDAAMQVLDLPYAGKRISMTVILPKKIDGLAAIEKDLNADKLGTILKTLHHEKEVHVHLPRFKVEKSFELKKPLIALGMKAAFSNADFSGMHNGGEGLSISAVIHKAFVDVNEEGTEAAAATGVVVGLSAAPMPPTPKHFKADHPFLFLIRDQKTGSVLFMGHLDTPKA